ncbi:hypothetical protein SAMN04489712_104358 [Thermomonospora echinospora]|uniref:Uncharacterized protein n=1 Tax=Thermomonospora echinospora TaxID=1992 RepID=A0A1H5Z768_9ACTN|nr:hypothetical protein [Thermomonospora echinospora]SEG31447.1 hypothetical protein SAMN04489712_104358 [Thermomonospora echinospora]
MFGRRDELAQVEARLAELEERLAERVDAVSGDAARIERKLDDLEARLRGEPVDRVEFLLASVAEEVRADLKGLVADAERLRQVTRDVEHRHEEAERALRALVSRLEGGIEPPARSKVVFNKVYRAETLLYVAAYFTYGKPTEVSILAGDEDPPTTVCSGMGSDYASAIIRPGEYWMVKSKRERSDVKCLCTPLY